MYRGVSVKEIPSSFTSVYNPLTTNLQSHYIITVSQNEKQIILNHKGFHMKKLTTAVLLTLGLGTALFACSADGCEKRGGAYKNRMHKVIKQLDLSDAQKEQMKDLKESRKVAMKEKRKEFRENRKAMRAQMKPDMSTFMTANTFDKVAFKQEMQKKFEARHAMKESRKDAMLESRADNMEKIFNILTPEQRIKWIELSKIQNNGEGKNCKRKS